MTQINIITGIYAKTNADLARTYPVNMQPIVEIGAGEGSGISRGYLKLSPGIRKVTALNENDRGGFVFVGRHIRVVGTTVYEISSNGTLSALGDVGSGGPVTFAEGFGRLGINSGNRLYYLVGNVVTQVTDPDLGVVNSLAWSDGYFLTTDGDYIVATELNDPTSVDPLKYGSSEADPDPVVGLLALRGRVYGINRYSIEVFLNQGTTGFPFTRSRGSQIPKGCVGANAFTTFIESFAFVGSARNETPSVYLAGSGQAVRISQRELDVDLAKLTEAELSSVMAESRNAGGILELLIHLPNVTWAYNWSASQQLDQPVWSKLAGGKMADQRYPARNFTYVDGDWWCGGVTGLGVVDEATTTLFGEEYGYHFDTPLIYNNGMGAIIHELELVTLTGRARKGEPSVFMSFTDDGVTYSQERACSIGARGDRTARVCWRRVGRLRHWRGLHFRGIADAPVSYSRLEARLEGLGGA